MADGYTLKVDGVEDIKKLLSIKRFETEIVDVLDAFGKNVTRDAKDNLSVNQTVDRGLLSNSINYNIEGFNLEIVVNADYAAYVEFGTRKFGEDYISRLPADWKEFASNYKGSGGGSFDELVMRIFEWVKRKGIKPNTKQTDQEDTFKFGKLVNNKKKPKKNNLEQGQQQMAYAIAVKIVRDGIRPQPFLFPAFEKNRPVFLKDLNDLFNVGQ